MAYFQKTTVPDKPEQSTADMPYHSKRWKVDPARCLFEAIRRCFDIERPLHPSSAAPEEITRRLSDGTLPLRRLRPSNHDVDQSIIDIKKRRIEITGGPKQVTLRSLDIDDSVDRSDPAAVHIDQRPVDMNIHRIEVIW